MIDMDVVHGYLPQGLPVSVQVVVGTLILGFIYSFLTQDKPFAGFPVAFLEGEDPKKSWLWKGRETLAYGLQKFSGPFQVITGTGPKIVLPNRFADELRNHPNLDFTKAFNPEFFVNYPGFEAFRPRPGDEDLMRDTVRVKLTQSLGLVTNDLVDETIHSVHDQFGDSESWTTRKIRGDMVQVVARLSSRVFLGLPLCRNQRWLDIAASYTIDSFIVSYIMRATPSFLRPISYWLIPQSRSLRQSVRDARAMITPEVQRRVDNVNKARAAGLKPPKVADSLGWMYEMSKNPQTTDFVASQLSLTMAAIHTTTEGICGALLDICQYPDVADELREEIVEVIGAEGWTKTALYKLRLMDSFLKEGQRLRPLNTTSMQRYVESPTTLSDGSVLPKGSRIVIMSNYMDPTIYPEPEKFDAHRFLKLRSQPGQENSWQTASTSPQHIFFGHGQHACPGRFFAVNELKIALCHLLIKYDWRFVPGKGRPEDRIQESGRGVKGDAEIECRRRRKGEEEIDLDGLVEV